MCAIIVCFCCCTLLHVAACWLNVHQETLESDERPSELSDITEEPEEYQDCSSDEVNTGRNLSNKRQGEGKSFLFLFYFSIYFPHLTVRRLGFSPVALIIHIYVFLFFSPFLLRVCVWLTVWPSIVSIKAPRFNIQTFDWWCFLSTFYFFFFFSLFVKQHEIRYGLQRLRWLSNWTPEMLCAV